MMAGHFMALTPFFAQANHEPVAFTNCFVGVHQTTKAIGGYYTLSATAVIFDSLPDPFKKKLPRYPEVPAALVGRLAVDLQYRGNGLGETLLLDAMRKTLNAYLAAAVLVVDAKDEQAAAFYYRYGSRHRPRPYPALYPRFRNRKSPAPLNVMK
jgi:ribosomal protein S18 acetylase RimI-like enzyme